MLRVLIFLLFAASALSALDYSNAKLPDYDVGHQLAINNAVETREYLSTWQGSGKCWSFYGSDQDENKCKNPVKEDGILNIAIKGYI